MSLELRWRGPLCFAFVAAWISPSAQAQTVQLFSDNFSRTTGLGANWHTWHGSFTTDGSHAVSGTPPINGNWASVVPDLGASDYAISADIQVPPGSLDSGLVARSNDRFDFDDNLYAAQLSTDGNVHLYRRNSWNWTLLASQPAGITANTTYNLTFVVESINPVHLEVWVNGTQEIAYDDGSASQLRSGICGIENYDPGVKYANLTVVSRPAQRFFDDFSRTTGLGLAWQQPSGTFTTDGTAAISGTPPANGDWAGLVGGVGTADYSVSADITIPANSSGSGLFARSNDPTSFDSTLYSAQLASDGSAKLYRRNSRIWNLLASVAAGVTANTSYSVELVVKNSNPVHLEVWVNATRQLSYDDNSPDQIPSGTAGIEGASAGVRYTNFNVDALQTQKMVIPAYFLLDKHSDPSKPTDWARIEQARGVVQIAIALGATGGFQDLGGSQQIDAKTQFGRNFSAGQKVFGYVNTQFATVPSDSVIQQMGTWNSKYGDALQGMFLDNGPSFDPHNSLLADADFQAYYKPLYTRIRGVFPHWEVMLNSSQYSGDSNAQPQLGDDWILSAPAANYALLWENPMLPYRNAYGAEIYGGSVVTPPPWWTAEVNRQRIAHVVHTVNQNEVAEMITLSRQRGSPSSYAFDGTAGSYERVPCFFEQEVAAIQDHAPVAGTTWCDNPSPGACTDINTDSNNCGGCDLAGQPHRCPAGTSCSNGTCVAASCGTCPTGTTCSNGTCVPSCGQSNCGGCCDSSGVCHAQSNAFCGIRGSACTDCTAQGDICLETDTCTGQWACMDPTCRAQAAPACRAFCP